MGLLTAALLFALLGEYMEELFILPEIFQFVLLLDVFFLIIYLVTNSLVQLALDSSCVNILVLDLVMM